MSYDDVPAQFGCYERGEEIGSGSFGRVFQCRKAGELFAAKAIDLRRIKLARNYKRELKKLKRETDILKQLPSHPKLVSLLDIVVVDELWAFFVLELVPRGDLLRALFRRPGERKRLLEPEARYVFRQLVEGLQVLHSHSIIHRDLKLENVLVLRERTEASYLLLDVKITDFGLSKFIGEGFSEACSTVGSPRYMAPEVLAKCVHGFEADVWSLGIMLFVMLEGSFPTDEPKGAKQADVNKLVKKLHRGVSAQARSVLLGLLQKRLDRRTTLDRLAEDPWLSDAATSPAAEGRAAKRPRITVRKRLAFAPKTARRKSSSRAVATTGRQLKQPKAAATAATGRRRPREAGCAAGAIFSEADDRAVTAAAADVSRAISQPKW
eukprot:TRINITY_DN34144_c0_g1_i1.p1 TRINITY_DN34144_c0_g1~~TRINITY_DN34144_c0_g1_i1.p1  ORF type:complete len:391 (+),score=76.81 TRINITY_DN34144_c0_g1_i1:35-1174(+)